MFYTFNSQEERINHGGSAFIELQFCKLPHSTETEKLVSVDNITNWCNDSLYTDDENWFYDEYCHIFDCGVYNNLQSGVVDIYGINYYSPQLLHSIMEKLNKTKPEDSHTLLSWLEKSKEYNGFYILGL